MRAMGVCIEFVVLVASFILGILSITNAQRRYRVIQEDLKIEYANVNHWNILKANVFKFNDTVNAVNITCSLKCDYSENVKIYTRGFKQLNNKYQLQLFQYDTTIKQAAEMESFEVQSLRIDYTRPPIVWPLQKGVIYRSAGWNPDVAKFLPNIPLGSWMFQFTAVDVNKHKLLVSKWFFKIV